MRQDAVLRAAEFAFAHTAERARADYLAVSRNAHRYDTAEEWSRAEERAWDRVVAAEAALIWCES